MRMQPYRPEGETYVAKFGKTAVTLRPRAGERDGIYRGRDAQGRAIQVGDWPAPAWTVQVHGEMSTSAMTLEAAKAMGEHYARGSEANARTARGASAYALSNEAARAYVDAARADREALMAAFPYLPEEAAKLAETNRRLNVLESDLDRSIINSLIG